VRDVERTLEGVLELIARQARKEAPLIHGPASKLRDRAVSNPVTDIHRL
jgi:hypothetical protein